jgi:hypothetical protein
MTCAGVRRRVVADAAFLPRAAPRPAQRRRAQIFGNTNPDNPRHWLKTEGIDQAQPGGRLAGDWKVWHFVLDDNPGLSERIKERYRRQYTGSGTSA